MFLFNSISATFPKLNIAAPNSPQQTLEVDSITYSENPRTMSLLNSISAPLPKLDIAAPDSPQQALEVDSGTGSEKLHTMARLKPILATLPKLDIAAALLPNQTQETTSFTCFGRLPQEMKNKIWCFAAHQGRQVKLTMDMPDYYYSSTMWVAEFKGQARHPTILEVCKESRAEGMRYFEKVSEKQCSQGTNAPRTLWVNFASDTFVHDASQCDLEELNFEMDVLNKIKSIMWRCWPESWEIDLGHDLEMGECFGRLPSVKYIDIQIFDPNTTPLNEHLHNVMDLSDIGKRIKHELNELCLRLEAEAKDSNAAVLKLFSDLATRYNGNLTPLFVDHPSGGSGPVAQVEL